MSQTTTEDTWDFWEDEAAIDCVSYNARIDIDAYQVLQGIALGHGNKQIADDLKLPEQYVELLQSIFCSVGWCDYGTSPRACWIDHRHSKDELVEKYAKYIERRWSLKP